MPAASALVEMPALLAASLHAFQTVFVSIGLSPLWWRLPGNNHTLGFRFNHRHLGPALGAQ